MKDCIVRLGLAVGVILVITASLYALSTPRAVAIEPPVTASAHK